MEQELDEKKEITVRLGVWNGMERKEKEKVALGAAGVLAAPGGSLQSKEIWQLNQTSHPAKALLAAPCGHLCEDRSWEEAASLHVF